jgi:hypothetical protein
VDAPSATDAPATADAPSAVDAPVPTDAPIATDACVPSTLDTSAIDDVCTSAGDCPAGYVCQAVNGIVLQQACQIRCDASACACPSGTVCADHSDKAGSWRQCDPI